VLGVFRDAPEAEIDRAITEQLRQHVAEHHPVESPAADPAQKTD
jgi:hypothetical protein